MGEFSKLLGRDCLYLHGASEMCSGKQCACGQLCIGNPYVNKSRQERKKFNFGRKISERIISKLCLQELNARRRILPVGLWVVKFWSLRIREEHILRVLENSVLRKLFGPETEEVAVSILRIFRFCAPHQILLD